jgi:peptide/nickel transport system permease protein
MVQRAESEFTLDTAAELAGAEREERAIRGRSPWYLAWRRLRRNYVAFVAILVFFLIVIAVLLAPVYAHRVAHTGPNTQHVLDKVEKNGTQVPVVSRGGYVDKKTGKACTVSGPNCALLSAIPIGPQWGATGGRFVLGADSIGRDVAVRLLYGGRTSLFVGIVSSAICTIFAVVLALIAGYFGGATDFVITRFFDLFYAFPVVLLGIALGAALAINGVHWGPIQMDGSNIWIPTLVISYVLVPYIGRPLRGQVLSLREKEFIEAAIAIGASNKRLIFREVLPNVITVVIVLLPLMIATTILTEAALSYLSIGVQAPAASWGTIIQDGQDLLYTRPWVAIAPGIMIVLTVLALNVLGDGVRDALDPRAKLRIGE